jgi:hypothetical protein
MLSRLLRLAIAPKTVQPRWLDDRLMWVASIDRTLESACARTGQAGPRPLMRPEVVWSCVPALHVIKQVLADPARRVAPAAIRRLRALLTDGSSSPLFREDADAAREAVEELATVFVEGDDVSLTA